jgi:hypothetical protein
VIPRLPDNISPAVKISPPPNNQLQVSGAIGDKYNSLGGRNGFAGSPITNEQSTSDGKGKYQKNFKGVLFIGILLLELMKYMVLLARYIILSALKITWDILQRMNVLARTGLANSIILRN